MKKHGILNRELAHLAASLGHGDTVVIGDAGLPVPQGVPCIDLAVCLGVPPLMPVLEAVSGELCIERITLAAETEAASPALWQAAHAQGAAVDICSHEAFKAACARARAVVRTGDATPYTNIILHSGVPF